MHLTVRTHTADEEHVKPVSDEFGSVLGGQAVLAQQSLNRVDVLKRDIRSCALQIGVECEVMLGQASVRYALHNRGADRIRGGLDLLDHVVQQIIEDMPGIHSDLIQFRHNTIDAEGLIA